MRKLACLLLAAGQASRFGSPKQLAHIHGKPMVCHSLEQLLPLFNDHLYCVVGAHRDKIIPLIAEQAKIIEHENWQQGMGSSISKGMPHIRAQGNYDGILIALADQVALRSQDYQELITLFNAQAIVASSYKGRNGVPAIFPSHLFAELEALEQDFGARKILQTTHTTIIAHPLNAASLDIDTPANLDRYLAMR